MSMLPFPHIHLAMLMSPERFFIAYLAAVRGKVPGAALLCVLLSTPQKNPGTMAAAHRPASFARLSSSAKRAESQQPSQIHVRMLSKR